MHQECPINVRGQALPASGRGRQFLFCLLGSHSRSLRKGGTHRKGPKKGLWIIMIIYII